MRIGDTLKKAAGLFVELPEEMPDAGLPHESPLVAKPAYDTPKPTRTVEQLVREQPGPNLDQIVAPVDPAKPVIDANGIVCFVDIYKLAGLPTVPFGAEQVLELLASFPADLPLASKRATVKVTVDAMSKSTSVSTETLIADASRKLAALAAYTKSYSEQAEEYATKADAEIAALEHQIEVRKASIEDAKKKRDQMVASCTAESDRLDDVLEFFTLDTGGSKNAS